jgi:hypothetical protein
VSGVVVGEAPADALALEVVLGLWPLEAVVEPHAIVTRVIAARTAADRIGGVNSIAEPV